MPLNLEQIKKSEEINSYIRKADESLSALGYTEHSYAHAGRVSALASEILRKLGYEERTAELAAIAYTTGNKPFVTGSYTGNGSSSYRTINLGFRPSAVLISSSTPGAGGGDTVFFSSGGVLGRNNEFAFAANGFKVKDGIYTSSNYWLNTTDLVYDYIAFR